MKGVSSEPFEKRLQILATMDYFQILVNFANFGPNWTNFIFNILYFIFPLNLGGLIEAKNVNP
jgi:hypothetical protein